MKGHVTALTNLANDISLLPPFYVFLLPSKSGSQNPQVEDNHRQASSLYWSVHGLTRWLGVQRCLPSSLTI